MRSFAKFLWASLHFGLTGLLFWVVLQDLQAKGQVDPGRVGQASMLLLMCFAIVTLGLALLRKVGQRLVALWPGKQTVGDE